MNREIVKYPDPVLKKKAEKVKEITPEVKKLIGEMKEIVRADETTVGLAASQVGVSKRIIVVQIEKGPVAFLNPEIVEKGKETEVMEEGCLSLPEIFLKIKRWKRVKVRALDEEGREIKVKAAGFIARIFQQEIDHLNGVLFLDRLLEQKKPLYKLEKDAWEEVEL